jgi:hypothetical protein
MTLAWELEQRGVRGARQSEVPVVYQGIRIEAGFRADLTYLRLANRRLGLINFNVALIKDGIARVVNGLQA